MMNRSILSQVIVVVGISLILHACSPAGGNSTGSEFMPDMKHSVAYEANHFTYYSLNNWGDVNDYKTYAMPRKPVKGTIPRGYAGQSADNMNHLKGKASHTGISVPVNGSVPYYYEDTEEDRLRASAEIIMNPYPISDKELGSAEELYDVYCGICHGKKGDGSGYLVRDDGGVYPAQPANFLTDEFVSASNGRYYHAIMYGKNVMGSHADKLSYKERWEVIHYIRSLQAADKNLVYNGSQNSLNGTDIPEAKWTVEEIIESEESEMSSEGNHVQDSHSEEIQH